jgi:hypothetical protein
MSEKGRAGRRQGTIGISPLSGAYIPLDEAWDKWKAEQIRCAEVCDFCSRIITPRDFRCAQGFRSLKLHPECMGLIVRHILDQARSA